MPAPSSSFVRRALAAVLLAVVLVLPAGAAMAATAGPGRQTPSTEPAPSTPIPTPDTGATASTSPPPTVDEESEAAARDRANADLWGVWRVVMALGAVTIGLVVLLVLYVRASSPHRAVPTTEEGEGELDEVAEDEADDGIGDERVPATPVDGVADEEEDGETDRPLVAAAPARRTKRVEAPPKKLATPDAERVLIRPGRVPVRVPPSGPRTDGPPPPAPSPDRSAPPPAADPSGISEPPSAR